MSQGAWPVVAKVAAGIAKSIPCCPDAHHAACIDKLGLRGIWLLATGDAALGRIRAEAVRGIDPNIGVGPMLSILIDAHGAKRGLTVGPDIQNFGDVLQIRFEPG
jgi:hypothetical protein